MFNVTVKAKGLTTTLTAANQVVPAKSTYNPILGCVKMTPVGDHLLISATDGTNYEVLKCDATVHSGNDEDICVNAKMLSQVVKKAKSEEVVLKMSDGKLLVTGKKATFSLFTDEAGKFPAEPEVHKDEDVEVSSDDLAEVLLKTHEFVGDATIQPLFSAIQFESKGPKVVARATNQHMISKIEKEIAEDGTVFTCYIPASAAANAVRLSKRYAGKDDITIKVDTNRKRIMFDFGDERLYTINHNGSIPDLDKALEAKGDHQVDVDRATLLDALDGVSPFSDANRVKMTFEKNNITVEGFGLSSGQATWDMEVTLDIDEPMEIGFNVHYMHQIAKALESATITLGISDPRKPIRMIGTEEDHICLLMPTTIPSR